MNKTSQRYLQNYGKRYSTEIFLDKGGKSEEENPKTRIGWCWNPEWITRDILWRGDDCGMFCSESPRTDWPWYEGARACARRRRGKDSAARLESVRAYHVNGQEGSFRLSETSAGQLANTREPEQQHQRAEQQPAFASRPRLSVSTSSRQHRSAADLLHRVRPPSLPREHESTPFRFNIPQSPIQFATIDQNTERRRK